MKRTKQTQKVLAFGEVTGHAHRITQDVYLRDDGVREFDGATTVKHEEHKPVKVPDGKWASDQVRERDWAQNMINRVQD